jgi:hypothetical protein
MGVLGGEVASGDTREGRVGCEPHDDLGAASGVAEVRCGEVSVIV